MPYASEAGRNYFLSLFLRDEGRLRFEDSEDEHRPCRPKTCEPLFPAGADLVLHPWFHALSHDLARSQPGDAKFRT